MNRDADEVGQGLRRAAVPPGANCAFRPSIHSGEPSPKTLVMSPVGSVGVHRERCAASVGVRQRSSEVDAGASGTSGADRGDRVELGADVPRSTTTFWPGERPVTLVTLTFVAPATDGAASEVARPVPEDDRIVVLEHGVRRRDVADVAAALVPGTHGRGVSGEPVTVDHVEVGVGRGGRRVVGGVAPVVVSVQYLNEDENPTDPSGLK